MSLPYRNRKLPKEK
uniref:Uncharacterized protein n=1 Tax=Rhizophora mucronata TaxID=61149 RepID=A0A2P2NKN2_RHIMU